MDKTIEHGLREERRRMMHRHVVVTVVLFAWGLACSGSGNWSRIMNPCDKDHPCASGFECINGVCQVAQKDVVNNKDQLDTVENKDLDIQVDRIDAAPKDVVSREDQLDAIENKGLDIRIDHTDTAPKDVVSREDQLDAVEDKDLNTYDNLATDKYGDTVDTNSKIQDTRDEISTEEPKTIDTHIEPPVDDEIPLPPRSEWNNVLDHGLVGDGRTNDTAALKHLAQNTSITNWYFPSGHTFLITAVTVPSHVKAIFGGGTILAKANTKSDGSADGALILDANYNGLVIDGLTFKCQKSGINGPENSNHNKWPYHGRDHHWTWNGTIKIFGRKRMTRIQIRNNIFDQANFGFNAIKAFGGQSPSHGRSYPNTNMRIYNNEFKNFDNFAVEIIDMERKQDGSSRNITGCKIFNNDFHSGGLAAISFVLIRAGAGPDGKKDGTENYIYNNRITGSTWGIEYTGCSGLYLHNNQITNIPRYGLLGGQGRVIKSVGKNYIYNNHITSNFSQGVESLLYLYNHDDFYGNYIDSPIKWTDTTYNATGRHVPNGNWYNNTICISATNQTWGTILAAKDCFKASITNNYFYGSSTTNKAINLRKIYSGSANVVVKGNHFFMKKSSAACLDVNYAITQGNNTCNKGWTGNIPTGRTGAGLSDPNNIGPR